jgi:predicted aminopeptidase
LLCARQPIESVLADASTPPAIREGLLLVEQARAFAEQLGLAVQGQYTSFAAWPGDRVVTTLVTTRPGEVTPAGFRFLLLGHLPYKGFFDRARADRESEALRSEGLDVCELPVSAYSTLGWLDDPITEPMLRVPPGLLVETVLHELVHATVYVEGHADFNESVARFIGEEGSVRFYASRGEPQRAEQRRLEVDDARRIDAELLRVRDEIGALYAQPLAATARGAQRRSLEERARRRIAELPLETENAARLAAELRMNDACLAVIGTYAADLDRFAELLARLGGDLPAFVARLTLAERASEPLEALLAEPAVAR